MPSSTIFRQHTRLNAATNKTTKKISHTRRSPKDRNYPSTPFDKLPFNQVKRAIEVRTPYEAAKLLAAENGIGKVEVERDDAKLGTVTLELFCKADVAGGKSSYEVVRQAVRPRLAGNQDVDPDRRFDVTLLISGMDWLVPALVGAVFGTAHYLLLQRAKTSTGMEVPMKR
ncbi:PDDEXK family nuclease [Levilactobacillus brevis]|nr:hypothetical protein [Levilactobacillus brevis]MDV2565183.1 hypothetical protein [Levilactobacillus brevis]MDV2583932.1 hypothetical protein [Levilactobacillus brevis]